jgi:hypothetical protein
MREPPLQDLGECPCTTSKSERTASSEPVPEVRLGRSTDVGGTLGLARWLSWQLKHRCRLART